jgi:hypothetical protein
MQVWAAAKGNGRVGLAAGGACGEYEHFGQDVLMPVKCVLECTYTVIYILFITCKLHLDIDV